MKRLVFMVSLTSLAQTGSDPITDRMRYEIAAAQRDYLVAKEQYEQALARMRARLNDAEKACGGKRFDLASFECVEKPK